MSPVTTKHSARLRLRHGGDCEGCQDVGVRMALAIVQLAGWRIVRIEASGAWDPPDDFDPSVPEVRDTDWDRSGCFYDDENRPEGCIPLYRITDEWTPAVSDGDGGQ